MEKKAIKSAADFEAFFKAYNERNWDELFSYLTDDCVWHAAERRCQGREETQAYWLEYHNSIKETLGKPQNVVFGDSLAYLEVPIRMEFLHEGEFMGRKFPAGGVLDFWCADLYFFAPNGAIKECRVFSKFDG